ncbi:MAG: sigma-70 family RNA polymerase sigma factor [Lentisphaerales bacterium]|nr:sigma-70 family RNA polymerase sigma factor [Lentisphaerales bacterium]
MDYTDKRQDLFVELYSEHEPQIRSFLRSLLPTNNDVDEVLQEVSVVIWKKFDRFDESTDFMRWVYVIARLEALKYRRKHARNRLVFDDTVYTLMAEEGKEEHPKRKEELSALEKCLSTLPDNQRSLIDTIYKNRTKTVDLAETMKTTVSSLYMKLTRTRKALYKCIKQRVQTEAL